MIYIKNSVLSIQKFSKSNPPTLQTPFHIGFSKHIPKGILEPSMPPWSCTRHPSSIVALLSKPIWTFRLRCSWILSNKVSLHGVATMRILNVLIVLRSCKKPDLQECVCTCSHRQLQMLLLRFFSGSFPVHRCPVNQDMPTIHAFTVLSASLPSPLSPPSLWKGSKFPP